MQIKPQVQFYAVLEQRLEHTFKQPELIVQALTHRSYGSNHNERLEFLGESVLNLAVSQLLYKELSNLPEGDLSRVRANLVKQETLHQLALELGLGLLIKLGEGEIKSGGQSRPSILADALEAVIGAVFLDADYTAAQALVFRLYEQVSITPSMSAASKDAKTELQEWLQGRRLRLPVYRVVNTKGAAHQQTFEVECEILDLKISQRGVGESKRSGEQSAAKAMLELLSKQT